METFTERRYSMEEALDESEAVREEIEKHREATRSVGERTGNPSHFEYERAERQVEINKREAAAIEAEVVVGPKEILMRAEGLAPLVHNPANRQYVLARIARAEFALGLDGRPALDRAVRTYPSEIDYTYTCAPVRDALMRAQVDEACARGDFASAVNLVETQTLPRPYLYRPDPCLLVDIAEKQRQAGVDFAPTLDSARSAVSDYHWKEGALSAIAAFEDRSGLDSSATREKLQQAIEHENPLATVQRLIAEQNYDQAREVALGLPECTSPPANHALKGLLQIVLAQRDNNTDYLESLEFAKQFAQQLIKNNKLHEFDPYNDSRDIRLYRLIIQTEHELGLDTTPSFALVESWCNSLEDWFLLAVIARDLGNFSLAEQILDQHREDRMDYPNYSFRGSSFERYFYSLTQLAEKEAEAGGDYAAIINKIVALLEDPEFNAQAAGVTLFTGNRLADLVALEAEYGDRESLNNYLERLRNLEDKLVIRNYDGFSDRTNRRVIIQKDISRSIAEAFCNRGDVVAAKEFAQEYWDQHADLAMWVKLMLEIADQEITLGQDPAETLRLVTEKVTAAYEGDANSGHAFWSRENVHENAVSEDLVGQMVNICLFLKRIGRIGEALDFVRYVPSAASKVLTLVNLATVKSIT